MRLIDADALEKEWTIASPEPYNTDAVEVLCSIKEAPTVDAVPVVRCRDCKYYKPDEYECGCVFAGGLPYVKADDFCSYGERRDT